MNFKVENKFSVGDRVFTRDGREVEILKVDAPGRLPVIGMFVETGHACTWFDDGRFYKGLTQDEDLTPLPKRTREVTVFLNIYPDRTRAYNDPGSAQVAAMCDALAVAVPATVKVEW